MTTTETVQSGTPQVAGKPADTASTTKAPKQCGCLTGTGQTCDRTTQKAFAQGHDARMASRLAQSVSKDEMTADAAEALIRQAGGSDLLVGKMKHSAELRKTNASKPKQPKSTNKAAKAPAAGPQADTAEARAVASAGDQLLGSQVKVAHGDKTYDAVIVKDAAGQRVARHRLIGKNCDHEVAEDGTVGDKIK